MNHWYCLRTKPRSEKKVAEHLIQDGFEAWCPVQVQRRKWSDRIKQVEVPVLPSYILIKCNEEERSKVLQHPLAFRFLFHNGKPGIVRDQEVQQLKEILDPDSNLDIDLLDIKTYHPGEEVELYHPDFGELLAQVLQNLKRELVVFIPGLNIKLRISKGRIITD